MIASNKNLCLPLKNQSMIETIDLLSDLHQNVGYVIFDPTSIDANFVSNLCSDLGLKYILDHRSSNSYNLSDPKDFGAKYVILNHAEYDMDQIKEAAISESKTKLMLFIPELDNLELTEFMSSTRSNMVSSFACSSNTLAKLYVLDLVLDSEIMCFDVNVGVDEKGRHRIHSTNIDTNIAHQQGASFIVVDDEFFTMNLSYQIQGLRNAADDFNRLDPSFMADIENAVKIISQRDQSASQSSGPIPLPIPPSVMATSSDSEEETP